MAHASGERRVRPPDHDPRPPFLPPSPAICRMCPLILAVRSLVLRVSPSLRRSCPAIFWSRPLIFRSAPSEGGVCPLLGRAGEREGGGALAWAPRPPREGATPPRLGATALTWAIRPLGRARPENGRARRAQGRGELSFLSLESLQSFGSLLPYPPICPNARRISGWLGSIWRERWKLRAAPSPSPMQSWARPTEAKARALRGSAPAAVSKSSRAFSH